MRVPQGWFTAMKIENGPKTLIGAIHVDELNADQIMAIHRSSGHPEVRRTTYFIRRICPATPRAAIKMTIRTCEECQFIDPAPVHWEKGTLEVDDNWQRLGMDITHYGAHHFLMLTDCGPSCSSIWRQCFLNVAHPTNSLQIMTLPSTARSSGPLQMIGESTYSFVAHTSQPGME